MINLPYLERAHEAFKMSMFDDALKYYTIELDTDPLNIAIMINIGFIHYFRYDLFNAKFFFSQALQLSENSQIAWFGLFLVARRMKDRDLERQALYKVYEINELPFDMLLENVQTFYEN